MFLDIAIFLFSILLLVGGLILVSLQLSVVITPGSGQWIKRVRIAQKFVYASFIPLLIYAAALLSKLIYLSIKAL